MMTGIERHWKEVEQERIAEIGARMRAIAAQISALQSKYDQLRAQVLRPGAYYFSDTPLLYPGQVLSLEPGRLPWEG